MRSIVRWVCACFVAVGVASAGPGYFRGPAIHGDTIVFTAESDLWRVGVEGGLAQRLTTHDNDEFGAAISPDGETIAFTASYEGPAEVYTMPLAGGAPKRMTHLGQGAFVRGWTPSGKIMFATAAFSSLPNGQLATVDPGSAVIDVVPLHQAANGVFDPSGATLFFERLSFQGSPAKRYKGGTAQNLWRFTAGADEAEPLTPDYAGTSKDPMWWDGRVYFLTDRGEDGSMNVWSMSPDGTDLRQHTAHAGWDAQGPDLDGGRIVYQLGADLRVYDIATDTGRVIPISLVSDFDATRENWVKQPMNYVTSAHISPEGDRVALTARGRVFVAPAKKGRRAQVTRPEGARHRNAMFMPEGEEVVFLSDETGELELWTAPSNGIGTPQQLSSDGDVFRYEVTPSPDGNWIAYRDKNSVAWLLDIEAKARTEIVRSENDGVWDIRWAPDSRWLAYVLIADNSYPQIHVYAVEDGTSTAVTSDRVDSYSPTWSPDGKWLYFLSDRHFESRVGSPWGPRQPEPYFDGTTKLYMVSLTGEDRSPFEEDDEVYLAEKKAEEEAEDDEDEKDDMDDENGDVDDGEDGQETASGDDVEAEEVADADEEAADSDDDDEETEGEEDEDEDEDEVDPVVIAVEGMNERVLEAPVKPGNYGGLSANEKHLFWLAWNAEARTLKLQALEIKNDEIEVKTLLDEVNGYELSRDGKKILARKGSAYHVCDAGTSEPDLDKTRVDLSGWTFSVDPREEWRLILTEAWRYHRDYFYDPDMHGVDWDAMLAKYMPLVERVTHRSELNDIIAQMVSELSALHTYLWGGDRDTGDDSVSPARLGARLARDEAAGGYRVEHVYASDPNYPTRRAPLAKPGLAVVEGDVIEAVNGVAALSVPDIAVPLRSQAGRQTLLTVRPAASEEAEGEPETHRVVVKPISPWTERNLRYGEWEYRRRQIVDEKADGDIGYVHLRAMGAADFAQWAREYYPVFDRKGLIVDVRHNGGGNIDSWILSRLLRKAWMYWAGRKGSPAWGKWNMQYAFRGHVVALVDAHTGSDGEAFAEGFKRLGIGKVIGTRTWGGEIWLSMNTRQVDNGLAAVPQWGVFGPEGEWMVEGHGVDPDIVVDNLPHATYNGADAQLDAAIAHLQELIRTEPVPDPTMPPRPDKSYGDNRARP
ncbi:protease [Candidatus Poribacteria bacterium]|nr:protease [Candidatus Poribacteria bacterium]